MANEIAHFDDGFLDQGPDPEARRIPEVVVCEHIDFGGKQWRVNTGYLNIGWWNDRISSVIVVSGTWQFFEHENLGGTHTTLKPGYYRDIHKHIGGDTISSFKIVSW